MTNISDMYDLLPDIFNSTTIWHVIKSRISRRTFNRQLAGYIAQKRLIRLRAGAYAKSSADRFGVATYLYKGYVGFSSALYLHGLKNEVEDRVYACTTVHKSGTRFLGIDLLPIYLGALCFGTTLVEGVSVSTYAKTIFDMLYRPRYANYFDMYRALNTRKLSDADLKELLYYARKANLSTVRRMGYALEGLVPKRFCDELHKMDTGIGKSFFHHKVATGFSRRWLIYDDAHISRWKNAT